MAKQEDTSWITRLPGGGGDWGRGILATVKALGEEIEALNAREVEAADRVAKAKEDLALVRAETQPQIKARQKIIEATIKRAAKDVTMLYADSQIAAAMQDPAAAAGE